MSPHSFGCEDFFVIKMTAVYSCGFFWFMFVIFFMLSFIVLDYLLEFFLFGSQYLSAFSE